MHIKPMAVRGNVLLFTLLSFLSLTIAFTGSKDSFQTSTIVSILELSFILAYLFLRDRHANTKWSWKSHKAVHYLLLAFLLSVTASFFSSPLELWANELGRNRFAQTIIHLAFFGCAFRFLCNNPLGNRASLIILMLPISGLVLAAAYPVIWMMDPPVTDSQWFHFPPFASHIRHIGYLLSAASSVVAVFIIYPSTYRHSKVPAYLAIIILSTFLFWTGGRAASGAFVLTVVLAASSLIYVRRYEIRSLLGCSLAIVSGGVLSNPLSIYTWSGLINRIGQTKQIENLDTVSSGRVDMWQKAVEALDGHWALGYGPQGFYFLPERPEINVQPHNLILQFLVEWGIVGTTIFLLLLALAAKKLLAHAFDRQRPGDLAFYSALAMLSSLTIHSFVDGTYFHGQPSFYVALALAVGLSSTISNSEPGSPGWTQPEKTGPAFK